MIIPFLICLAYTPSISASFQATVAEEGEYLEYRTWSGQHWRVKATEPKKLITQHMPDEKKVSEEKTVDSIQYKTGGGAKYTATIEEKTEKGVKSFVLRHVSENGKDNHLDTHISYVGWDNQAHIAVIVNKDGQIRWSQVSQIKSTAAEPSPADKKPTATKPVEAAKTKTGG
jgi:hypothetical protein